MRCRKSVCAHLCSKEGAEALPDQSNRFGQNSVLIARLAGKKWQFIHIKWDTDARKQISKNGPNFAIKIGFVISFFCMAIVIWIIQMASAVNMSWSIRPRPLYSCNFKRWCTVQLPGSWNIAWYLSKREVVNGNGQKFEKTADWATKPTDELITELEFYLFGCTLKDYKIAYSDDSNELLYKILPILCMYTNFRGKIEYFRKQPYSYFF